MGVKKAGGKHITHGKKFQENAGFGMVGAAMECGGGKNKNTKKPPHHQSA